MEDDSPGAEGLPGEGAGAPLAVGNIHDESIDREFEQVLEELVPVTVKGDDGSLHVEGAAGAGAAAALGEDVDVIDDDDDDEGDGDDSRGGDGSGDYRRYAAAASAAGLVKSDAGEISIETLHLHVPNFRVEDLATEVNVERTTEIGATIEATRTETTAVAESKDPVVDHGVGEKPKGETHLVAKSKGEARRAPARAKPIVRTFSPEKQKYAAATAAPAAPVQVERVQPRTSHENRCDGARDPLETSRTTMLMEERHFRRQLLRETMRRMELDPEHGTSSRGGGSGSRGAGSHRDASQTSAAARRESDELSALYKEWHDKLLARESRNETNERAILQQMAKLAERSLSLHMYEKELTAGRAKAKAEFEHREGALRVVQGKVEAKLAEVEATEVRIREHSADNDYKAKELKALELALRERATALAVREKVLGKEVEEAKEAARDVDLRRKTVSEQARISQEDALSAKLRLRELHKIALGELDKRKAEAKEGEQRLARKEEVLRGREVEVERAREVSVVLCWARLWCAVLGWTVLGWGRAGLGWAVLVWTRRIRVCRVGTCAALLLCIVAHAQAVCN